MKLIDTSAWIHALRTDGDFAIRKQVDELLRAGDACWCAMVRLELWTGARGRHEKNVLREMERVLPDVEITGRVWNDACAMARRTRESGKSIPASDLLIAACAHHHGLRIVHDDKHFDSIAGFGDAAG
jgi:predicted nucleic acid-binding protein